MLEGVARRAKGTDLKGTFWKMFISRALLDHAGRYDTSIHAEFERHDSNSAPSDRT